MEAYPYWNPRKERGVLGRLESAGRLSRRASPSANQCRDAIKIWCLEILCAKLNVNRQKTGIDVTNEIQTVGQDEAENQ